MKILKLETQTALIIFYVLYFLWLALLVFLSADHMMLNYISYGAVILYFVFLYEKGDVFWFLGTIAIYFAFIIVRFKGLDFDPQFAEAFSIPYWLPLAWGTTTVALRKIYFIIANREHY